MSVQSRCLRLTVHLNREDTLLAGRPHRGFDAGLAHQVVVEGVLPGGQVNPADLAGETAVVPAQAATQGDLLNTRTDILRGKLESTILLFPASSSSCSPGTCPASRPPRSAPRPGRPWREEHLQPCQHNRLSAGTAQWGERQNKQDFRG